MVNAVMVIMKPECDKSKLEALVQYLLSYPERSVMISEANGDGRHRVAVFGMLPPTLQELVERERLEGIEECKSGVRISHDKALSFVNPASYFDWADC